jgi:hypothetical protein
MRRSMEKDHIWIRFLERKGSVKFYKGYQPESLLSVVEWNLFPTTLYFAFEIQFGTNPKNEETKFNKVRLSRK